MAIKVTVYQLLEGLTGPFILHRIEFQKKNAILSKYCAAISHFLVTEGKQILGCKSPVSFQFRGHSP